MAATPLALAQRTLGKKGNEVVGVRFGLVLSGNGVHGFAHIGMLMALAEAGLEPTAIAATGTAALVAGLYAYGLSPVDLTRLGDRVAKEPLRYFAPDIRAISRAAWHWLWRSPNPQPMNGWLQIRHFAELLRSVTGDVDLAALPLPVAFACFDLRQQRRVVLSSRAMPSGLREPWHRHLPLATALLASFASPGAIGPVQHGPNLLVSGEVLRRMPVDLMAHLDPALDVRVAVFVRAAALPPTASFLDVMLSALGADPDTGDADLVLAIATDHPPLDLAGRLALVTQGYETGTHLAAWLRERSSVIASQPPVEVHPSQ